jgi:hypothetical protein
MKWVSYMSPKSHTHKKCGTLRKKSFSARGYAEIHIQRPFFDNKKRHIKNSWIENPNGENML